MLLRTLMATALALLLSASAIGEDKPAVTVTFAKLPQFDKIVQSYKGKVVVVDVWSTT